MKTKKSSKNLVLNKKTIAKLNNMNDLKGGGPTETCDTCLSPPGGSFCIACYERPGDITEGLICYPLTGNGNFCNVTQPAAFC